MTTKQIYELAVALGIKADLRGSAKVKKYLARTAKKFSSLDKKNQGETSLPINRDEKSI